MLEHVMQTHLKQVVDESTKYLETINTCKNKRGPQIDANVISDECDFLSFVGQLGPSRDPTRTQLGLRFPAARGVICDHVRAARYLQ